MNRWLSAFRLRTLPLSLSGIIAGSAAAYATNAWDGLIFSLAITTTLFLQILSNLANDLGDSQKGADNENRLGPMRAVQSGEISQKQMKNAVILFALLSLISAAFLIVFAKENLTENVLYFYLFLAIASIIAAITYTVGKKAYGYHGLGDIMVFIFFGLVSVLGVYSLYTHFSYHLILLAATFGFLSTAVLNLNNLRDHQNDKNVGKRTLVVHLGWNKAKFYHYFLVISGLIIYAFYCIIDNHILGLLGLLVALPLFKHLVRVKKTTDPKLLDSELKVVALSTFSLSILYGLTLFL